MRSLPAIPPPSPAKPTDEVTKLRALQQQLGVPDIAAGLAQPSLAARPAVAPAAASASAPASAAPAPRVVMPGTAPVAAANPYVADEKAAQEETGRLRSTGSGVSQIKNPWLRAVARIGDVAGTALFPGVAAAIPGTTLHHDLLIGQQQNRIVNDQKQDQAEANVGKTQADTDLEEANAKKAAERTPEEQFIADYRQRNPNATMGDVLRAYGNATMSQEWTPVPTLGVEVNRAGETRPLTVNGQPVFDSSTARLFSVPGSPSPVPGHITSAGIVGADGKPLPGAVPYQATPLTPRAGTVPGPNGARVPATALWTERGFVDANTQQPLSGFQMGEPQQPNWASIYPAMQGAGRLTTENENWGKEAGDIQSAMQSLGQATNGSQLAASLGPLQTALTVVGAGGVHRLNMTEIGRSGDSEMGSLGRRIDAALEKAGKGALPPQTVREMQQLLGMYQDVLYKQYVARARGIAKNYKLPLDEAFVTTQDGSDLVPLSDVGKHASRAAGGGGGAAGAEVEMIAPDGQHRMVRPDQVEAAIKAGGRKVGH